MAKISSPSDCGNSQKKEFIKDFNIAFADALHNLVPTNSF